MILVRSAGLGWSLLLWATVPIAHADRAGEPAPPGGRIPLIRIGIAPEAEDVRVSARGEWSLGILGSTLRPARIAAERAWTFRADGDRLRVIDDSGVLRGQPSDTLYAFPSDLESGPLVLDGAPYRGELLLWARRGRVTAVNVVDLESYLLAVLPPEMGPQPPVRDQALRAQAVAARSYTLAMMGRWADRGFDLLATVEDQVYGGIAAERPACSVAVEETRGEVAVHGGLPIRAFYSSTCGGHTAATEEVWNRPPAPYLRGVRDRTKRVDRSFCAGSPFFQWTETWSGPKLEEILRSSLSRVRAGWDAKRAGRLTGISLRERSPSQRAARLRLEFQKGHVDLSGDEIRWVLRRPNGEGLRSALLTRVAAVRKKGRVAGVRIEGQGYGHGVGMCQYGAMGMAESGYDHKEILRFYYSGAQVRRFY